jgi:hypothetical protein
MMTVVSLSFVLAIFTGPVGLADSLPASRPEQTYRGVEANGALYLNGSGEYWYYYLGMTLDAGHLYFSGDNGMDIYDLTRPDSPKFCSHVDLIGESWGVAVSGDYAYVTLESAGLQVIDVSAPYSPHWVSSHSTNGPAYRVKLSDTLAYVANGTAGLAVMSLADPVAPKLIAAYPLAGNAVDLCVRDTVVFIADGIGGVQILNVANPINPVFISSFPADTVSRLCVQSDYLYALGRRLSVVDISDLSSPQPLGSITAGSSIRDLAVNNGYAFVGEWVGEFSVYDISDPSTPHLVSNPFHWSNYPLLVDGNTAWVGQIDPRLLRVDISNPAAPVAVGWTAPEEISAKDISVGSDLNIAVGTVGVRTFYVNRDSRYFTPYYSRTLNTPGNAVAVARSGSGTLVVADSAGGLQIGTSSTILGHCVTKGAAIDVATHDNYACVAERDSGIEIVDIHNPLSPSVTSHVPTLAAAVSLCMKDTLVCVAESDNGVELIDMSSPSAPVWRSRMGAWGRSNDVSASNSLLAIADDSGLVLADIADADTPSILARVSLPEIARRIAITGDTLLVSTDKYIYFFDVQSPSAPENFASLRSYIPRDFTFALADRRAYVAYDENVGIFYPSCCDYLFGNIDCDPEDRVDISDITALIDYLYISFRPPCCLDAANYDRDDYMFVDISDLTALINDLYISPTTYFMDCRSFFEPYLNSQRHDLTDSLPAPISPGGG